MIDISIIAKELNLPPEKVQRTVELLGAGNSIPFISRFRKDETGALDEQQVLSIKRHVSSLRALAERKAFILKSIESQDKLTDQLKVAIDKATTSREVEDCYLPFKLRKKSRANEARQKGLGPLAEDIFKGNDPEVDLAAKATQYVRVDKGLTSVDEVISGVGDLLAEQFANDVELKNQIREIVASSGKLVSKSTVVTVNKAESKPKIAKNVNAMPAASDAPQEAKPAATEQIKTSATDTSDAKPEVKAASKEAASKEASATDAVSKEATATEATSETPATDVKSAEAAPTAETKIASAPVEQKPAAAVEPTKPDVKAASDPKATPEAKATAETKPKPDAAPKAKKKKKKKKKTAEEPFKLYFDFKQPLSKVAHFQTLAINRGERARKLSVEISCDEAKITELAEKKFITGDHPFAAHLKTCIQDALQRFIRPSIEREIRREMTEAAEKHAVNVVSDNLRILLMQPPSRNRRVLAIHPGYKRGCAIAILETNGEMLHSDHAFVVGNQTRRDESKKKIADLVTKYDIDVIAVGNGPAGREAERMVSDAIENHLIDNKSIRYLLINEAGINVYSTSEVARQELPNISAAVRCAIAVGRRLQEPMSELVKVSPAGLSSGTFQHDVRTKHLAESLDDVVQFCVNRVGVDANTANSSLLSCVSGLNPLTATRMVEYRKEHGEFKNREQLKSVSGVGEETFLQAAGFLRISGGDSPLDSTSIHPENYSLAEKIIQKVGSSAAELFPQDSRKRVPQPAAEPAVVAPAVAAPAAPAEAPSTEAVVPKATTETPVSTEQKMPAAEPADQPAAAAEPAASETSDVAPAEAKTETKAKAKPAKPVPPRPYNKPSAELVAARKKRREIIEQITALDVDKLAAELSVTPTLVTDVIRAIKKPDWDPREKRRKPLMRRTMIAVGDLEVGQEIEAQVVNVVDFGAFVDIGIGESCLVHVSQLSNRFIRDPQILFSNGDVIRVWVSEIDSGKRRVKLTAVRPGTERTRGQGRKPDHRSKPSDSGKPRAGRTSGRPDRGGGKKPNFKKSWKPKPRAPKPVKPITDDMLKGEAPMTSFSDLMQFVKKKPDNQSDK